MSQQKTKNMFDSTIIATVERAGTVTTTTVYDDVFRTLITDCPSLIIPVLNEVFHHNIDPNAKVQVLQNEVFLSQPDGNQKRITDSNFLINALRYHVECQTNPDNTMFVRIWEYDSQIALQDYEILNNTLTVKFPHTTIIYLRHYLTTPDTMNIRIQVPGDKCSYEIPVIKLQHYTIDQIFENELYLFIPYHIFSYEKHFKKYEKKELDLRELQTIYIDILKRLDLASEQGIINEYTKHALIDMTRRVTDQVSRNYNNVREGIGEVMGGKVLNYEAKDILNRGIAQGRLEGELTKLLKQISIKLEKGKSIEQIADETEETIERIQSLIEEHGLVV